MENKPLGENISDSNSIGVELLITDAGTANILLDLAQTTHVAEDRSRRIKEAHDAYKSIRHFLARLSPTPEQMEILRPELEKVKARLIAANVPVE